MTKGKENLIPMNGNLNTYCLTIPIKSQIKMEIPNY